MLPAGKVSIVMVADGVAQLQEDFSENVFLKGAFTLLSTECRRGHGVFVG
jgi:hypothetical protein